MTANQNGTSCEDGNEPLPSETSSLPNQHLRKKNLTSEERVGLCNWLLLRFNNGKLEKNAISGAAAEFGVSVRTVSTIWRRALQSINQGQSILHIESQKKGRSGRKRKDWSEKVDNIKNVPLRRRSTLRSLSFACGIPKTTLFRLLKDGCIKRISSTVKPLLTEANKIHRLKFALSFILPNGCFHHMKDYVHIDEKWFYITKVKQSYYLVADEEPPERDSKSKRYITKVMFMAAVARPQWDAGRNCWFDGKLGLWPFVTREPAKRSSKNRPRGTMETKAMVSVDKNAVRKMICDNVIPSIREKMPRSRKPFPIYIQQDNAKPHTSRNDPSILEEGVKDNWNIIMTNQPPNSPDFNVLDLGFFNSIQSLQHEEAPSNIDELITAVDQAYWNITKEKLDNTFLSYQNALECAMKVEGSNSYKLVHMNKEKLRREGRLPENIICSPDSILIARSKIDSMENSAQIAML